MDGDIYLARLGNSTGGITFAEPFGTGMANTAGAFFPWCLATDAMGHVYLAGAFRGQPLVLNGVRLANMGPSDEGFAGRVAVVSVSALSMCVYVCVGERVGGCGE